MSLSNPVLQYVVFQRDELEMTKKDGSSCEYNVVWYTVHACPADDLKFKDNPCAVVSSKYNMHIDLTSLANSEFSVSVSTYSTQTLSLSVCGLVTVGYYIHSFNRHLLSPLSSPSPPLLHPSSLPLSSPSPPLFPAPSPPLPP